MRITPKQYAIGLYEATNQLPKEKAVKVIERFVEILKRNNHLKMETKIIEEYNKHLQKSKNITRIRIKSREKVSADIMNKIIKKFEDQVEIVEEENPEMIGGISLEINENTLIDGSIDRKLSEIKNIIN